MKDLTFRGHAQRKRFNPIQVPDQAQKILNESERVVRGMKDVQAANLSNREAWLAAFKEKNQKEERAAKGKFDIESDFAEAYQDAEKQHHTTRQKSLEFKAEHEKAEKAKWEKIKTLSVTAIGQLAEIDKKRGERLIAEGAEIATRFGLTPMQLKPLDLGERQVGMTNAGINGTIDTFKKSGNMSPEMYNALISLSGRRLLGAQIAALTNAGKYGFPKYWGEVKHQPVAHLGGKSISDLERDGKGINSKTYRLLSRHWETQYLSKFKGFGDPRGNGYKDEFLTKHLRPHMQKFVSQQQAEQQLRDMNAAESAHFEARRTSLEAYIFGGGGSDPGYGFHTWYTEEAGMDTKLFGDKRREGFQLLSQMAASGQLKRGEWAKIQNFGIQLGGKGKVQSLRTLYSHEMGIVNKAFEDREKRENQVFDTYRKNFGNAMRVELATSAMDMGRNLNNYEVNQIKDQFVASSIPVPDWLTNYENHEEMLEAQSKISLDTEVRAGTLTMAKLYSGNYNSVHLKEYEKHTIDGAESISATSRAEFTGSIKAAIQGSIGNLVSTDERSSQTRAMTGYAIEKYNETIKENSIAGIYSSPLQNHVETSKKFIKEIEEGKGDFARITKDGREVFGRGGGFALLEKQRTYDLAGVEYREEVLKNPQIIHKTGFMPTEHVDAVEGVRAGEAVPGFINQIAQVTPNSDQYDIINAIMRAEGREEIERPGASRAALYVHPRVQRLIKKGQSMSRTMRAMTLTTEATNPDADPLQPGLDLIIDKQILSADPQYGGHDTINSGRGITTGTLLYKKPVIEMTVGEVLKLQRREGIRVGAYQFNHSEINRAVQTGRITSEDLFDEVTQRRLAIEQLWRESGQFETDDGQVIEGLGQAWDFDLLSKEDTPEVLAKKEALGLAGINVFQLREGLLY